MEQKMAVKWTEEQQKVIDTRDRDILVSAAAGSGKTAVLVARILALITDGSRRVDIDRLLVVTFTNAAAAEMRGRIREALEQRGEEEPENMDLQRQLVLVHNAQITTIHSFCLNVLRNHFQTIGLDPSFRVGDEGEIRLLEQETVKETVDAAYEQENPEFSRFLEEYITGKSDHALEEMILQMYHFALGQPWPQEWLQQCRDMYGNWPEIHAADRSDGKEAGDETGVEEPFWLQYAAEDTGRLLADLEEQTRTALGIAEEPEGPYPYIKALEKDLELIRNLQAGKDYHSYGEAFYHMPPFTSLGRKKDDSISEEKKQQVQAIRSNVKNGLAEIRKMYYFDREEILGEEFEKSGRIVRVLTELTEQFMERLTAKKKEKNVLDFGDLEHLALRVLTERKEGRTVPTAAAAEYAENFAEIMIDEYQDSNLVQELILTSISGRGCGARNLFMVGDVKQSIYRFRLARPELFMEKYRRYQKSGDGACRIDLHRNFRSRPEVLDSANRIFRQIMTENLGGVEYDEDAALYPGAIFPEKGEWKEDLTECCLMEAEGAKRQQAEAGMVGRRIREIVGRELVWDKELEQYRTAGYGDIVILLRTVSGWAENFGEVLGNMGIPCFTGSQKGYFSAAEIRVVLSYLQILDNPIQDIPLAAVLRSAIGGFTDEELAKIKAFKFDDADESEEGRREDSFYGCCRNYLHHGTEKPLQEKLRKFFKTYEALRSKCAHTPVHLLIWELLDVTGYGTYAAALPGGAQRRANLDMLVEKAIAYESASFRGLYHFVRYIENLKKYEVDYGEANIGSEAGDAVRIMSIHKSKGLEFPVVFVCGMGKQFNESDVRSKVVMHPDFGIGCDCVDEVLRTRRATILKRIIQQKTTYENLGEELRVLYVAMTRAKEKLILTGTVSDLGKSMEKWQMTADSRGDHLAYSDLAGASAYLDWVMPCVLRQREDDPGILLRIFTEEENDLDDFKRKISDSARLEELLQLDPDRLYHKDSRNHLEKVFSQVYVHEQDADIIGKLSVSELKKMSHLPEEQDARELYMPETVIPLIPGFMEAKGTLAGAARGTVYHTFMENLDYSRKDSLEIQLEELISCGKMSQEEASALNLDDIRVFLAAESGIRMERAAASGRLYREQPFVLGVPASEIRGGWNPEETVLVQGIIDAWFREEDGLVVLDYKTDKVPAPQTLVNKYRAQLDYYTMALERLTGCHVKERIIYSFYLGKDIIL